ncbi:MAG: hypothetical protein ACI4WM_10010 [Erysipelotrichaceae bacterium]
MNRFDAKTYPIAYARYKQGYTVSLSWLCEYLDVSSRWLKDNILKHVNYTVYSLSGSDYIRWSKEGRGNGTFVDLEEINDFIIRKCIEGEYFFEAQTEVIDLYSYLEGKASKRNKALKIYNESFSIYNTGYGRLPKKLIEYIDNNYLKGKLENVSVRTLYRKDEYGERYIADGRNSGRYPWIKVNPVNIFDKNIFLYFPKRDLIIDNVTVKAGEHIHRYAFMHGAVRLCMGKSADGKQGNKVIYIGKKQDPAAYFKIPYTIPYGKSINRF